MSITLAFRTRERFYRPTCYCYIIMVKSKNWKDCEVDIFRWGSESYPVYFERIICS